MKRLLLALFVLGVMIGVVYAWFVDPIHITEAAPDQVTKDYQHMWIVMAAEALAQDGDWGRTRARLDTLRDPDLPQTVKTLFEQADTSDSKAAARALAQLADRLDARTAEMSVYLITPLVTPAATPELNAPTPTTNKPPTPASVVTILPPTPSVTPSPTFPTPIPTYNPSYQIINQIAECTRADATPQIRITVQDVSGQPLAGVTIWVTWDGGRDRSVTGLKPEINAGYADFDMLRDRNYNVSIDQPESIVVPGLQAEPCASGGSISWRLIIRQTAR